MRIFYTKIVETWYFENFLFRADKICSNKELLEKEVKQLKQAFYYN